MNERSVSGEVGPAGRSHISSKPPPVVGAPPFPLPGPTMHRVSVPLSIVTGIAVITLHFYMALILLLIIFCVEQCGGGKGRGRHSDDMTSRRREEKERGEEGPRVVATSEPIVIGIGGVGGLDAAVVARTLSGLMTSLQRQSTGQPVHLLLLAPPAATAPLWHEVATTLPPPRPTIALSIRRESFPLYADTRWSVVSHISTLVDLRALALSLRGFVVLGTARKADLVVGSLVTGPVVRVDVDGSLLPL